MKKTILILFSLFVFMAHISSLQAYMSHMLLTANKSEQHLYEKPIKQEWREENLPPFDELMLTWNAVRPTQGKFLFYVSLKTDEWSPWLLYSTWGSDGQSSFDQTAQDSPVKNFQDAVEVLNGKKATAFQVKIATEGSARLDSVYGLHVYTNGDRPKELQKFNSEVKPISLKVPGLSQMTVDHVRHKDLCSPTSTTAVTRYLSNNNAIDPVDFAQKVWDAGFDIYGNWVFNTAHAASLLGPQWNGWVERLNGFTPIYQSLEQGIPVIVSVRGPLPGGALPYAKGHLIAIIEFDPLNQKVLCMDPAFPTDAETHVSYHFSDFMEAWGRRGNVGYIFSKSHL